MADLYKVQVGSTTYDINNTVNQQNSTANGNYRILISSGANDTNEANKMCYKSSHFQVNPSTGRMRSTTYNVADQVTMQYNSTTQALDFIFS